MNSKRKTRTRFVTSIVDDTLAPTRERTTHGSVERLDKQISDEAGGVGLPYRSIDLLAAMERRGAITPGMRQAGQDFSAMFRMANLDPLGAFDLGRPMVSGRMLRVELPGKIEDAREGIWQAILAVGGLGSPSGSCLWHVVGWERTLKEWALSQCWIGRNVSQAAATGILMGALGTLEAHLGSTRQNRK